jgi:excisionase family DNA binding protein
VPEHVLLTIPEAAAILRVSRTTAFVMARNGEIPTVRIGGRVMVPTAHLQAWIEERVVPANGALRLVDTNTANLKAK